MRQKKPKAARKAFVPGRFKKEYEQALERVRADKGSPYDVSQGTINATTHCWNWWWHKDSEKHLAEMISRHNAIERRPARKSFEAAAANRLEQMFKRTNPKKIGPDLLVKAFYDLDRVFFNNELRHTVSVRWVPRVTEMSVYGFVEYNDYRNTARITIDASRIFLECREESPYPEMWSTLLHEMVHALTFIKITRDKAKCDQSCSHARTACSHGPWFRLMLHSIHRRAKHLGWLQNVIKGDYSPDYREGHPMSDAWREV